MLGYICGGGLKESMPDNDGILWRSLVDNLFIETVAAVFINVSAVVYGHLGYDLFDGGGGFLRPWMQLVPAIVCGMVILTCRDENYMPPDASPTLTLLFWCLGAYKTWMDAAARMLGHAFGFGISLVLCKDMGIVAQALPYERPGAVVFGSEAMATCIEHMSLVYLLLPLMPSRFESTANKAIASSHIVAAGAFSFAFTHWCLRVTFAGEMSPTVTLLKAILASWQPMLPHITPSIIWHECTMMLWGQCVGMLVCIVYCVTNMPKTARANFGSAALQPTPLLPYQHRSSAAPSVMMHPQLSRSLSKSSN